MTARSNRFEKFDSVIAKIIDGWYERVREHYVTEEDGKSLGIEPEIKSFHEVGNHRIKFSRKSELDVTYGLGVEESEDALFVVSSVNNKSKGFDYDRFVQRLQAHYWRSRNEKPWTDPEVDHFAYGDLLSFEPRMGKSVSLDIRKQKADIVRLLFRVEPSHEKLLTSNDVLLSDLIENFCLNPLKRIFAESYREQ